MAAKRGREMSQEDLDAQLEEFMRRQAEIESGAAARKVEPGQVLGAEEVSEEAAKAMCREIVREVKRLKELRDMSLNEVRLTVAIEDPRARERRLMGIEVGPPLGSTAAQRWAISTCSVYFVVMAATCIVALL